MSAKLPRVPASRIITLLKRKGFTCVRQSGSHKIFKNDAGIRVVAEKRNFGGIILVGKRNLFHCIFFNTIRLMEILIKNEPYLSAFKNPFYF